MTSLARTGTSRESVMQKPEPRTQDTEINWLLRRIPADEYARLLPHLERVTLEVLEVLAERGGQLPYAFFPESSIISVVRPIDDTVVEAGTIGCEGMAGLGALLGATWSPSLLLGQIPGSCTRVDFETFRQLLAEMPVLRQRIGQFTLAFLDQVGQTVACNTRHEIEQRCARWLLLTRDRVQSDVIRLTHEVLAQMLGVRRAGVSETAAGLQRAGLIRYSRGKVTIVDRAGLERLACECYAVNRTHMKRLMGDDALPGT